MRPQPLQSSLKYGDTHGSLVSTSADSGTVVVPPGAPTLPDTPDTPRWSLTTRSEHTASYTTPIKSSVVAGESDGKVLLDSAVTENAPVLDVDGCAITPPLPTNTPFDDPLTTVFDGSDPEDALPAINVAFHALYVLLGDGPASGKAFTDTSTEVLPTPPTVTKPLVFTVTVIRAAGVDQPAPVVGISVHVPNEYRSTTPDDPTTRAPTYGAARWTYCKRHDHTQEDQVQVQGGNTTPLEHARKSIPPSVRS